MSAMNSATTTLTLPRCRPAAVTVMAVRNTSENHVRKYAP